jgi:hypothetical protein
MANIVAEHRSLGALLGRVIAELFDAGKSYLNIRIGDGSAPWLVLNAAKSEELNRLINSAGLTCSAELQIGMSWIFCPDESGVRRVLELVASVPFVQAVRGSDYVPTIYDNYRRDVSRRFVNR